MLGLRRRKTGQVSTTATSTAAVAFLGHVAGATCSNVVIGDVAAIGGLIPDAVAFNIGSRCLTGNRNVCAFVVGFDNRVGGSWAGAAVDSVSGDGVGVDDRGEECSGESDELEMHFDEVIFSKVVSGV
jgi:hypothetical protein